MSTPNGEAPRTPRPPHLGTVYSTSPVLHDLGWWMYEQRNRIRARWQRSVERVERKKKALYEPVERQPRQEKRER